VGKTTLLRQVISEIPVSAGGFFTEEVRVLGKRVGFDIVTLDGQRAPLAREGWPSPYRVGRYGVDRDALEGVGVAALQRALERRRLLVVDEIGKMEMCSGAFLRVIEEALQQGVPLLGTIMAAPHPFADKVKSLPGVWVLPVLPSSREQVQEQARRWVNALREGGEGTAHPGG
jgi:nucleoside-triphosphatase